MHTLEQLTAVLEDGEWHDTASLRKDADIPKTVLKAIIDFLEEYGFIEVSKNTVRLSPSLLKMFSALKATNQDS